MPLPDKENQSKKAKDMRRIIQQQAEGNGSEAAESVPEYPQVTR